MLVDLYSNRKLHDIGITYYSTFCVHLKIVLLGIKNAKEKRIKIIVSALPIPSNYSLRYNQSIFKS